MNVPQAIVACAAFGLAALCVVVVALVNAVARRAERIYRARHRDHSKVPSIHG